MNPCRPKGSALLGPILAGVLIASILPPVWVRDAAAGPASPVGLTIMDIQEGLASGDFTAVGLLEAHLRRIDAYEDVYNAFVTFNPDALNDAAALDAEYAVSGPRSPLHGVPIVIKEAMDVKGLPSTAGFAAYAPQVGGVSLIPSTDAPVVARLREAGAVIIGKTNIPAFSADGTRTSGSWDGPTFNAYDPSLAPGASSSGTATAVAASFAVLGTAEETGGSIQNPAAAQSLVGIKPTFGLVPNTGVAPLAGLTRDVVGPHARTVTDAAIALDVMAGYTPEDPKTAVAIAQLPEGGYSASLSDTALEGKRIGLFGSGWRDQPLTPQTRALYDEAIATIEAQGATVVDDPFAGSGFADLSPSTGFDLRGLETIGYDFQQYLRRLGPTSDANTLEELTARTGIDVFAPDGPLGFVNALPDAAEILNNPDVEPDIGNFLSVQTAFRDVFRGVMEANDLDALAFPQMWKPTPPVFSNETIGALTVSEINLLGTPGVTVPAGYYDDGSPFSLLFLADAFQEAQLLGYAFDYEQATLSRQEPVLVPLPAAASSGGIVLAVACGVACRLGRRRAI